MAPYKGYTEARKQANKKYRESMEQIRINLPKGRRAEIKEAAAASDESLNGFIVDAINQKIKKMNS